MGDIRKNSSERASSAAIGSVPCEVVLIGADDQGGILDRTRQILGYIAKSPSPSLRDIAFTSGINARGNLSKAAVVASTVKELADRLELLARRIEDGKASAFYTKGIYIGTGMCPAPGRTVFLFPGEGSQYPDMLRDLSMRFPACRSAFDDADTASAMAGAKMAPSEWIFPAGERSARPIAESMGMAAAVQSVIAANTGLLRLFTALGVTPDAVAGAGIGELVALEAAGAIRYASRRERLETLSRGHKLMMSIPSSGGAMPKCSCYAVSGVTREKLDSIIDSLGGMALVTRDQAAELFTACARAEVAADFEAGVEKAGGSLHRLPINQPFHTPWVEPFIPELKAFYNDIAFSEPDVPIYSFITAAPLEGPASGWGPQATAQWSHPTRIRDTINRLYDDGFRVFLELGARGSLSACVASVLRRKPHVALAANSSHRPDIIQVCHAIASLAAHGLDIDVSPLFAGRDAREVDFSHPGPTHAERVQRPVRIDTALPILHIDELPKGLTTSAPRSRVQSSTGRERDEAVQGSTRFPLVSDAEIVRFVPGEQIDLVTMISLADHPFLADRSLCPSGTSRSDNVLRGYTQIPAEAMLEIMAETALKVHPDMVVTLVEDLKVASPVSLAKGRRPLRVKAARVGDAGLRFAVEAFDSDSFTEEKPTLLASAMVTLADAFPSPTPPSPLALVAPTRLDWQGADLYPTRLTYGPAFQSLQEVPLRGDNGLHAVVVSQPRTKLVRLAEEPVFAIDPVLLSAIGAALAVWRSPDPACGTVHMPCGCDSIQIFAPQPQQWTKQRLNIFAGGSNGQFTTADADIIDDSHRLALRVKGWRNKLVYIGAALHRVILHPDDAFFTSESGRVASLPHDVVCCSAPVMRRDGQDDLLLPLDLAASATLSRSELTAWRELSVSQTRRIEWLFGRIAAKEAVRRCLLARYGRKWPSADIRIESDEQGKPRPEGEWRRFCGAPMDISITHTQDRIYAAAAPNSRIGIDVEGIHRVLGEEFVSAAFSPLEQEVAAESGDGATALLRFWCAKEALSKALGTGLRYGTGDLCARSIDMSTGIVGMEATRLWLQPFPELRGRIMEVRTFVMDDVVVAICVLPSDFMV